jgi:hypothetical protein
MEANRAAENLQTIRTLMERSALYRRALAPIMIYCGVVGICGGIVGWQSDLHRNYGFVSFWILVAALALAGSLMLVRRQAFRDSEPFWSPPTRRVALAMLPPFFIGLVISVAVAFGSPVTIAITSIIRDSQTEAPYLLDQILLVLGWTCLFGCAVHAAGFFMPRGIKWFGWIFIGVGCALLWWLTKSMQAGGMTLSNYFFREHFLSPHLLMGGIFGGLHLAYGIYLYLTEKKNPTA